jgi:hypothetical protein
VVGEKAGDRQQQIAVKVEWRMVKSQREVVEFWIRKSLWRSFASHIYDIKPILKLYY